jgi:hypothetical protein
MVKWAHALMALHFGSIVFSVAHRVIRLEGGILNRAMAVTGQFFEVVHDQ